MKTAGIRINRLIAAVLAGLAWGVLSPLPAAADDGDWPFAGQPEVGDLKSGPVWDEAQSQGGSGPAVSLKEVRRIVRRQIDGEILDTQLYETGGGWIYRVRVLQKDGRVVDVGVDGNSGQIVDVQG
ncbi:MAG: PepSY domain-containing protein [Dongiaceae bacterium]